MTLQAWLNWAAKVEGIMGHDLDGDQEEDGYSLDAAYTLWEEGYLPHQAVAVMPHLTKEDLVA